MEHLPQELLGEICNHLDTNTMIKIKLLNKHLNDFIDDTIILKKCYSLTIQVTKSGISDIIAITKDKITYREYNNSKIIPKITKMINLYQVNIYYNGSYFTMAEDRITIDTKYFISIINILPINIKNFRIDSYGILIGKISVTYDLIVNAVCTRFKYLENILGFNYYIDIKSKYPNIKFERW